MFLCVGPSRIRFRKSNVAACFILKFLWHNLQCVSCKRFRYGPCPSPTFPSLPSPCPLPVLLTAFRLVSSKYSTFLHTTGNWLFIDSSSRKGQQLHEKETERARGVESGRVREIDRGRERGETSSQERVESYANNFSFRRVARHAALPHSVARTSWALLLLLLLRLLLQLQLQLVLQSCQKSFSNNFRYTKHGTARNGVWWLRTVDADADADCGLAPKPAEKLSH